jgi:ADP-ribose pyrophosphatase YjhB (NUDIX family)
MLNDWRLRLEPWITPLFRAWWRVSRPKTLGVRALVLDPEGRILLVRHSYLRGWHLPGGGVERGETAVDAIVREVAEEGGVRAVGMPALIGLYSNHANFANDNIAIYRIDAWTPCERRASANEIAEAGFFARDALPEGVTKATLRRLAEYFDGAAMSATW